MVNPGNNMLLLVTLVGWLALLSLGFVGYLFALKVKEMRRNRRLDQERERLGLRRIYAPLGSWLL